MILGWSSNLSRPIQESQTGDGPPHRHSPLAVRACASCPLREYPPRSVPATAGTLDCLRVSLDGQRRQGLCELIGLSVLLCYNSPPGPLSRPRSHACICSCLTNSPLQCRPRSSQLCVGLGGRLAQLSSACDALRPRPPDPLRSNPTKLVIGPLTSTEPRSHLRRRHHPSYPPTSCRALPCPTRHSWRAKHRTSPWRPSLAVKIVSAPVWLGCCRVC